MPPRAYRTYREGTLSQNGPEMIPTVMNNLASQGFISKQVLDVYFAPGASESDRSEC